MHKKSFEVVEFDGEIDEMLEEDAPVGKTMNGDQEGYVYKTQTVNAHNKPWSLSDFAREVKGGNRTERRAEAKKIRKAFK
jgi:hypothetical protein